VIVRLSDFKTNEYAQLIGGEQFESSEQNPMLGLRGASRYYHEKFRDAFRLECEAINAVLAEKFAERFDGFSIGSNDLTQFVLGVDRDSAQLAEIFDERNEAVKSVIHDVIRAAHKKHRKVGLCGEAPSNYPEFAAFLVKVGIDSISINPDRFVETKKIVAKAERRQ
jgi:pyruvate, water dikinase